MGKGVGGVSEQSEGGGEGETAGRWAREMAPTPFRRRKKPLGWAV